MKRNETKEAPVSSAFAKLCAGLEDAIAYHRGDRKRTVREVHVPEPEPLGARDIVKLRETLRVSQAALARLLNVSARTVQAWERGTLSSPKRPILLKMFFTGI